MGVLFEFFLEIPSDLWNAFAARVHNANALDSPFYFSKIHCEVVTVVDPKQMQSFYLSLSFLLPPFSLSPRKYIFFYLMPHYGLQSLHLGGNVKRNTPISCIFHMCRDNAEVTQACSRFSFWSSRHVWAERCEQKRACRRERGREERAKSME